MGRRQITQASYRVADGSTCQIAAVVRVAGRKRESVRCASAARRVGVLEGADAVVAGPSTADAISGMINAWAQSPGAPFLNRCEDLQALHDLLHAVLNAFTNTLASIGIADSLRWPCSVRRGGTR